MSDFPSTKAIEMGLKMCATRFQPGEEPDLESADVQADLERDVEMQKAFIGVRTVQYLHDSLHLQLHHSPIASSPELQRRLLLAIMAKMFLAGWSAGRQEIIDTELARMTKE